MANEYTPTVWRTGDVITAEKLNKIEEGIANAGQPTWETLYDGSVTTESTADGVLGNIQYDSVIEADKIKVTFNGTEYECDKMTTPVGNAYGGVGPNGPDFSEFPFAILSGQGIDSAQTVVYTETAGTYTLKIEVPQSGESDFSTATIVFNVTGENATANNLIIVGSDFTNDDNSGEITGLIVLDGYYVAELEGNMISAGQSTSYSVLIANDKAISARISYNDDEPSSVTGNAEIIENEGSYYIKITGDCTITAVGVR